MKNILLLTTQLSMGGAEKVFYDHIKGFSGKYNVVVCLFTEAGFNEAFTFDNTLEILDDIAIPNPLKRWQHRVKRLQQIVRWHKIDVCISHMEGPNFLNGFTKLPGVKKIGVSHGSAIRNSQKSKKETFITAKVLMPVLYNRLDKVVTVSEALKEEHIKIGVRPEKLVAIHNFFDTEAIAEKAAMPIPQPFEPLKTLVHVGRLAPEKNQKFLLHLLKYAKDNGSNYKLIIVGEGPEKNVLLQLAEQLQLSVTTDEYTTADVLFTGTQTNPYKYVAKAGVFMLCSYNEGFPLVLGEALACGTPVLSIDCPTGPREILDAPGKNFTGTIPVPPGYAKLYCGNLVTYYDGSETSPAYLQMWYDALQDIFKDAQHYQHLKSNCLQKAKDFDKSNILSKWYGLLD